MTWPNPVAVLLAPTAYILFAALALAQFRAALFALAVVNDFIRKSPALSFIQPVATHSVRYLDRIFGPAHKWTPTPNQVIWVAMLLALIVHLERRR